MKAYNYHDAVVADIRNYITENNEYIINEKCTDRDELFEYLYDNMFTNDSVTGNGSGSYTFNTFEAEENLCHNLELLGEALNEFGCNTDYLMTQGAEACDVTIRCYLLSECLNEVLDDIDIEEYICNE